MPYILVSVQTRLQTGPTTVGDDESDQEIMQQLGAKLLQRLGDAHASYQTPWPPRKVLDKCEELGYRVVSMTGVGQTCCWVLHREITEQCKQTT